MLFLYKLIAYYVYIHYMYTLTHPDKVDVGGGVVNDTNKKAENFIGENCLF